jgi:hypothetical protein
MKKYMGVWNWESLQINIMNVVFPSKVTEYTPKNMTNMTSCISGSVVNPNRMNSVTVWLPVSWLKDLEPANRMEFNASPKTKWGHSLCEVPEM